MKTINVKIKGDKLMMDRFPIEWELEKKASAKRASDKTEPPIEMLLHSNGEGIFIPSVAIKKSLKEASKRFIERKQTTYFKSISGGVQVEPECVILSPQEWEVLTRALKKDKKATIIKSNPVFHNWSAEFQLSIDELIAPPDVVKEILITAGKVEGLLSWRPNCGGEFGKFTVVEFK